MTDRELLELMVNKMTNMEQDLSVFKKDIKDEFSSLKTDFSSLKPDISSLKTDVSLLKTDVSLLKSDVASIKEEQRFMKQAIFELDARSISTDEKIDALTENVSRNTEKLDEMHMTQRLVNDHDTDIRIIKKMLIQ
ncbi:MULTISPECIES: hypothetical protein [unclassified Sporosarcina]|uniref:hypothetical protein n=1 Tax=unclassified Sporosarcina TaxID=2647733 RepID=UPI000C172D2B|nr:MULTISPECIES: hypothetical protein [unclassified Sporosarcina]PID07129.1 hypothetical protein CSV66_00675 [Sporosarcina sp. P30]PID10325.1 hypothetical protein CSV65_00680 [Sporosarcina sp. P31]PID12909.1 hypothetical protein CSV64_03260 [Sporosarcina sp. P32b]